MPETKYSTNSCLIFIKKNPLTENIFMKEYIKLKKIPQSNWFIYLVQPEPSKSHKHQRTLSYVPTDLFFFFY